MQAFWDKNRKAILLVCAVALLAIIGREGWGYYAAMREKGVQEDYAKIADDSTKLASFADAHAGHVLAGVAYLRVADEKYSAGDYKQAQAGYQKAIGSLKHNLLIGRAKLGAAVSQAKAGDVTAGEAALRGVLADAALQKGVRAEAAYHLALLARDAGKPDEVKKLVDEVGKIDSTSSWFERATLLLAAAGGGAKAEEPAAPAITFKPGGN